MVFKVWAFFTAVMILLAYLIGGMVDAPFRAVNTQILGRLVFQTSEHFFR
jgi:hypothetical protein